MKATALSMSYETDEEILENFIPEGFELLFLEVHVLFSKFTEINWMVGGQYNLINVAALVRFNGKNGEIEGAYALVVWENKTAPISGGREQTGIPKIYADIEDLHILKPNYATTVSYEGNTFLNMDFEASGKIAGAELEEIRSQFSVLNTIGWRYIPKVGAPGAELSQFILYPQSRSIQSAQKGKGNLKWTELTPMQNPAQWWIVNSLAALPIKKITQSILYEANATLESRGSRIIE